MLRCYVSFNRLRQAGVNSPEKWGKGTGWQAGSGSGSGSGRVVRQAGSKTGHARVKNRRARKRETGEKQELRQTAGWLEQTRQTGTDIEKTQV
jgi:hypothetical protein